MASVARMLHTVLAIGGVPVIALLVIVAALAPAVVVATAQTPSGAILRGRVVRKADATPVAGADVWLVSADAHVTTDSSGAFRILGASTGVQLVQVRRVGFDVVRDAVAISAEHENVRTYALAQSVTLDTVHTRAANRQYISPHLQAFEERRLVRAGRPFHLRQRIPAQREHDAGEHRREPSARRSTAVHGLRPGPRVRSQAVSGAGVRAQREVQSGNTRLLCHDLRRRRALLHTAAAGSRWRAATAPTARREPHSQSIPVRRRRVLRGRRQRARRDALQRSGVRDTVALDARALTRSRV